MLLILVLVWIPPSPIAEDEKPVVYQVRSCDLMECSWGSMMIIGKDEEKRWLGITARHVLEDGGDCHIFLPWRDRPVVCEVVKTGDGDGITKDWAILRIAGSETFRAVRWCEGVIPVYKEKIEFLGYQEGMHRLTKSEGWVMEISRDGVVVGQARGTVNPRGFSGGAMYLPERRCVAGMVVGFVEMPCGHHIIVGSASSVMANILK